MFAKFSIRSRRGAARFSAVSLAGFTAIVLMTSLPVRADVYWSALSGNWSSPANWLGTLPTSSDDVWIVDGGTAMITASAAVCSELLVGSGVRSGTIQMTDGNLTATYLESVGDFGTGTFAQTGGTNSINNGYSLVLGSNTGTGSYCLSGGLLSAADDVGDSGIGTFVQSGGTNNVSKWGFYVGYGPSATATYNLSGTGFLSAAAPEQIGFFGRGTFVQSGGTNVATQLCLANYSASAGTYNLNGGLLQITKFTVGSGAAALSLSGGTLQASGSFSIPASANFSVTARTGGAIFDPSGNTITVNAAISGSGGLTQFDSGTLVLTGNNAYGGPTMIDGGTLMAGAVNTLSASSDVTVDNYGTLDVSAFPQTVKSLTIGSGGALNISVGNVLTSLGPVRFNGTLNLSNLGGIVSGGTTELISYLSYSGSFSSSTRLPAGDSLVYGSGALDIVSAPPTWQAATWLGDWNVASNWTGGVVPNSPGAHAAFLNTTGSAQLVATNLPIALGILDLTGSNNTAITGIQGVGLTMQTTGGSTAQINVSGGTNHEINLPLTFDSNAEVAVASGSTLEIGNPLTVNADVSVTMTGTVQLDSRLYVAAGGSLQENGAFVGSGNLLKNGPGTLILSGNDTYTGGTTVGSGTLRITSSNAYPGGTSLTVGAGATFVFDPSVAVVPTAGDVAVPEPSTLALLGVGAIGLLGCAWRRRSSRKARQS